MLRLILKRDFREILKRIVRKVILIQCKKALPKAAGALQLSSNQDTVWRQTYMIFKKLIQMKIQLHYQQTSRMSLSQNSWPWFHLFHCRNMRHWLLCYTSKVITISGAEILGVKFEKWSNTNASIHTRGRYNYNFLFFWKWLCC